MTYQPGYPPVPRMVSTFTSGWASTATELALASDPASATWATANQARYVPILVPTTCVVRRVWWANGGTVSASYNVDCGVYSDSGYKPGSLLVSSGSTAQGTASQVQFADVTDTTLAPGRYWLALVCSSGSATFLRSAGTPLGMQPVLMFAQSTAFPLPASATPGTSSQAVPLCGFATTASP